MLTIKKKIIQWLMNLSYVIEVRQDKSTFYRVIGNFVYKLMRLLFGMIPYRAISHKDYCILKKSDYYCIRNDRVGYSSNVISNEDSSKQKLIQYPMNDLVLYHHQNVYIQGGSGLVLDMERRLAINDYCAIMGDNTSYQDSITITTKQKSLLIKIGRKKRIKSLLSGIMINDRYAANYYHGLYEILIKLLILEEVNEQIPAKVPIIIDAAILNIASLKKAFQILTEKINRPIEVIRENERLYFEDMWFISPVNFIQHRINAEGRLDYYLFDKNYILLLKKRLLEYKKEKEFPRKVFISRKSTKHRNYNEEEVFSILEPMGFQKVAPELMTFEEQMSLFNSAEWIISGAGAAFTNLLFASSGCKVVCLCPNYSGFLPPVFTTTAYINGCIMRYFKSDNSDTTSDVHANYNIDIKSLEIFIKKLSKI